MGNTSRPSGTSTDGSDGIQQTVSQVPQLHKPQSVASKPRIKASLGMWECYGRGLHSFGKTPEEAYNRWLVFIGRMRDG